MSLKDDIIGYLQEDVISAGNVDDLNNWAADTDNSGSNYSGMTYEQGIRDTLEWLAGYTGLGPHE